MTELAYLMYHEIEREGCALADNSATYKRYAVKEREFHNQLKMLSRTEFHALSVSEALSLSSPSLSVAMTFDDGCETDLTVAVPALQEFGFQATFYVVPDFFGQTGYLSGSQVRKISDWGFEVGCHSRTHANLCKLDAKRLYEEVAIAKADIEQAIGREVRHFSCPGGFWSPRVAKTVCSAGFASLATSRIGLNSPLSDRYRLARIAVYRGGDLAQFERTCRGSGLFLRRNVQSFLTGAKALLGDSRYRRVRSKILTHKFIP
jgi:peptidoglycan/xylan/chitin deacetylase (PgdA/CDA1 family)